MLNDFEKVTAELRLIENGLAMALKLERDKIFMDRLRALKLEDEFKKHCTEVRRFPLFICEKTDKEVTIWYNNGTGNGLRVITRVTKITTFDPEGISIGANIETTWY